jgi:hypothetical protein
MTPSKADKRSQLVIAMAIVADEKTLSAALC